ncbi:MAG: dienelactone hydrolase family protein, partial [Bryobacterales bacterium]|nr:dienelactone hydrolase family protein [Bryobacterales bacterium]
MNILRTKHRSQWARVCALIWVLALPAAWAQPLAGTQPLTETGDVRMRMLEGLRGFLLRETDASVARRLSYWRQDFSSPEAYARSVAGNRARFARIIGLADHRVGFDDWTPQATLSGSALLAEGPGYRVYAVRWPVLDGVEGEGLLLEPTRPAAATVIALPDADSSPEALAGLAPGTPYSMQIARRLAESGCRVVVPVLIDRQDTYSGSPYAHLTNMAHREMIYRMAYQLGRHIIGYEVQKVLAVVDWAVRRHPGQPVGVAGYGEGGLLALYSAAADPRIDATLVSGYFDARQNLWQEPLYRNVWGLLEEFGDAELAWMIAPRPLVVEACRAPEIAGPPAPSETHRSAGAPGRLTTPEPRSVEDEAARARVVYAKLGEADRLSLVLSGDGRGEPGSEAAMGRFLRTLKMNATRPQGELARRTRPDPDRQRRQFFQLVEYTQKLARQSQFVRQEFWSKANTTSPARWDESAESYRRYLWEEVIGK